MSILLQTVVEFAFLLNDYSIHFNLMESLHKNKPPTVKKRWFIKR
ncbi:MAG TPA: hypothetical protein VF095_08465 [Bacillota bacterium]